MSAVAHLPTPLPHDATSRRRTRDECRAYGCRPATFLFFFKEGSVIQLKILLKPLSQKRIYHAVLSSSLYVSLRLRCTRGAARDECARTAALSVSAALRDTSPPIPQRSRFRGGVGLLRFAARPAAIEWRRLPWRPSCPGQQCPSGERSRERSIADRRAVVTSAPAAHCPLTTLSRPHASPTPP